MIIFICEPPKSPWEQFLESWRENSPEEKEKRERNEKNGAILFVIFLCLIGIGLTIYSILRGCGFI